MVRDMNEQVEVAKKMVAGGGSDSWPTMIKAMKLYEAGVLTVVETESIINAMNVGSTEAQCQVPIGVES